MNIAIIGYGKMGKMIEAAAKERGHTISTIIDPIVSEPEGIIGTWLYRSIAEADNLNDADVAIEFTGPKTAADNILALTERKIPVVSGTTGWYHQLDGVKNAVNSSGASLIWAPNFSPGINLFYHIAWYAAGLVDSFPEYDVGGFEIHHNKKADSPSGTAKTLIEGVLSRMKRKTTPVWDTLNRPPGREELHYPSLRIGSEPGTHSLTFDSIVDSIEIVHTARNREGFASGALLAAQWLSGGVKREGVFTFDDVLKDIIQK
jgi:4-hydroxy-tetrahydrodipicolinate reductase